MKDRKAWDRWLCAIAIRAISLYQRFLSPFFGSQCRFYPSCSHYAQEAFQQRPFPAALWLTFRRLLRCNPFHPGGYDPLDPSENKQGDSGVPLTHR